MPTTTKQVRGRVLAERPARHEESKRVSAGSVQQAAGSVRRQRKPLSRLFLALNSTGERGAKFHSKLDARALTHFRFQFFVVEPPRSSSDADSSDGGGAASSTAAWLKREASAEQPLLLLLLLLLTDRCHRHRRRRWRWRRSHLYASPLCSSFSRLCMIKSR